MDTTTIAIDIAKSVFQLHWVQPETGEICRRKFSRAKLMEFMVRRQPSRVVMEACPGAHHLGREFTVMGHQVQLLPAGPVRAFVRGNKDDAADARAIWLAAGHDDIRRVPLKSVEQQGIQALHRLRAHWMSTRNASLNCLRGLLYEFGVVLPQGAQAAVKQIGAQRERIEQRVPAMMVRAMQLQLDMLRQCDKTIAELEKELKLVLRSNAAAQRLIKAPGIGLLGATALAASLGDGRAWRNGRQFAACMGLPPAHSGTGGKVRMGAMTKRGDPYLRTLLISGARALSNSSKKSEWLKALLERRPTNVAVVAQAHKLARMAWALVAHGRSYDPQWKSEPPQPRRLEQQPA
jgi:transposase